MISADLMDTGITFTLQTIPLFCRTVLARVYTALHKVFQTIIKSGRVLEVLLDSKNGII